MLIHYGKEISDVIVRPVKDLRNLLHDPAFWISVVAAIAALFSAGFAFWSARISKRGFLLAEGSEQRKQPKLVPHFGEGYCKVFHSLKKRAYVFTILVNNPTDIANSLQRVELQVGYTTDNHDYMTVKLPNANSVTDNIFEDQTPLFRIPVGIEAHGSIAGSVLFYLDDGLVDRGRIDDFKLLITDTHDETTSLEPVIIRDLVDAKETENPGVGS